MQDVEASSGLLYSFVPSSVAASALEKNCQLLLLAGLRQCCHQFACQIPATQLNRLAPHQQKLKRNFGRRVVADNCLTSYYNEWQVSLAQETSAPARPITEICCINHENTNSALAEHHRNRWPSFHRYVWRVSVVFAGRIGVEYAVIGATWHSGMNRAWKGLISCGLLGVAWCQRYFGHVLFLFFKLPTA
jgi:hypothetical protein